VAGFGEPKMATTRTAAAGTFKSQGEDFIQFVDAQGQVVYYVDYTGTVYGANGVPVGAVTQLQLSNMVNQLAQLGIFVDPNINTPSVAGAPVIPSMTIDNGVF
jgi:tartrate dehydratase beta subunit/fumarate hydratase class I family protein